VSSTVSLIFLLRRVPLCVKSSPWFIASFSSSLASAYRLSSVAQIFFYIWILKRSLCHIADSCFIREKNTSRREDPSDVWLSSDVGGLGVPVVPVATGDVTIGVSGDMSEAGLVEKVVEAACR